MTESRSSMQRFIFIIYIALVFGSYLIYAALLAPLYTFFVSDIRYMDSILPDICELLSTAIQLFAHFSSFAIIIYAFARFQKGTVIKLSLLGAFGCVLKYLLNTVSAWILNGWSANFMNEDDLYAFGINTSLELFQYAVTLLLVFLIMKKALKNYNFSLKAAQKLGISYEFTERLFPFARLTDLKNPLLGSASVTGLVLSALRVISRISYDIDYTLYYGAPDGADLIWMFVYYSGDIICGILGYLLIAFVLISLNIKDINYKEKNSPDTDIV